MENRVTEQSSAYDNLQEMSIHDILTDINHEDSLVPAAVAKVIPVMEQLVERIVERMKQGGRMFYIGAGTSGRLGVTDASELPPTYGVPFDLVIGLIAGGDGALRKAVQEHLRHHPSIGSFRLGVFGEGESGVTIAELK